MVVGLLGALGLGACNQELWMPGKSGKIVRIAPANLLVTGDLVADVTLTPVGLGYASNMAFDPAPAVLPLRQ